MSVVNSIAPIAGLAPGRALLNADFSEAALKTEATYSANGILHIASHFSLRPGSDADFSLLLGAVGLESLLVRLDGGCAAPRLQHCTTGVLPREALV